MQAQTLHDKFWLLQKTKMVCMRLRMGFEICVCVLIRYYMNILRIWNASAYQLALLLYYLLCCAWLECYKYFYSIYLGSIHNCSICYVYINVKHRCTTKTTHAHKQTLHIATQRITWAPKRRQGNTSILIRVCKHDTQPLSYTTLYIHLQPKTRLITHPTEGTCT